MTRKAPLYKSMGRYGDDGPWHVSLPQHRPDEPCEGECLGDRYTASARLRRDLRGILSMTVTDRAKDIAVLRAMGSTSEQLRKIFLWQGFAIGASGTVLGLVIGYLFAWVAGKYQLIPLDPQVYAVP